MIPKNKVNIGQPRESRIFHSYLRIWTMVKPRDFTLSSGHRECSRPNWRPESPRVWRNSRKPTMHMPGLPIVSSGVCVGFFFTVGWKGKKRKLNWIHDLLTCVWIWEDSAKCKKREWSRNLIAEIITLIISSYPSCGFVHLLSISLERRCSWNLPEKEIKSKKSSEPSCFSGGISRHGVVILSQMFKKSFI